MMNTEIHAWDQGGNSGIGKQTVAVLASKGAKVYLAARSEDKYNEALSDIRASHPKTAHAQIEFLKLDLSSARSVKEAAEDFKTFVPHSCLGFSGTTVDSHTDV
jgi:NAD(P)-dependent dehydrogenase (short-subunit alcohol dehydrogenase family)